jgi:predicted metal-binding membrane protein
MTAIDAAIEAAVRRDRVIVVTLLAIVIAASWAYVLTGAGIGMSAAEMTRLSQPAMAETVAGMAMMTPSVWTPGYAALMFFMWWVMMIAMMLPSAAPMILLFAMLNRKQREADHPYVATSIFAWGYLAAWAVFSLVAVTLQWGFEKAGLLSPALVGTSAVFGSVVLLAAGVYQLSPIKHACLRHCRSPMTFLSIHWRPGSRGALRMGLLHGGYCVGCCWFLMGLLFFGGVMNLYWIAGLAAFVLLEKTLPAGHWIGYSTGIGLLCAGVFVVAV